MSNYLDTMKDAYDENFVLDNKLTLNWYPERAARLAQGDSVLELGLGHGYSTAFFAARFKRYLVVEGSQEMIDRFRSRFPITGVDIALSYFEDFGTSETFANIMMGFVLEHVEDPALILNRFGEFLTSDGSVFVAVPNCESLHRRLGHAAGLLPDVTVLSQADLAFGHRRYFSLKSLRALVESCGYRVVTTEGLFLKPVTTQQMLDLKLPDAILQAMLKVGVDYPELSNSILLQLKRR